MPGPECEQCSHWPHRVQQLVICRAPGPPLTAALMEGRRCFSTYVADITLFSPLSISALQTNATFPTLLFKQGNYLQLFVINITVIPIIHINERFSWQLQFFDIESNISETVMALCVFVLFTFLQNDVVTFYW